METELKHDLLTRLAKKRKLEKLPGYSNFCEFENGIFDASDNITPWTNGACNLDSKLMVVGQDMASIEWFMNPFNKKYAELGRDPNLQTNKNLERYLELFSLKFHEIYATNAFVHVKSGSMSTKIPDSDLTYSIKEYLLPQIEIVNPKMVICLGSQTFNSVRKVLGHKKTSISTGHLNPISLHGTKLYGVYHTGGLGTVSAGGKSGAIKQWQFLADAFNKL